MIEVLGLNRRCVQTAGIYHYGIGLATDRASNPSDFSPELSFLVCEGQVDCFPYEDNGRHDAINFVVITCHKGYQADGGCN